MIYLDNSATTVPDPSVLDSYNQVSKQYFANPSSIHHLGGEVELLQLRTREQAAKLLNISPYEVVFTSGGTEGNNLAIKGIALQYQSRGKHIITSAIEHPSVFEACIGLEALGFKVTYLPVNSQGVVSAKDVEAAITDETILISIMHVNNEVGSIQPIEEIAAIAKKYPKLYFHVDAVQSLGKIPLNLADSGIDLCTFSGHKINGLNGTGMLFVRNGLTLFPLFHGGNQEGAIRSGTENVAGNVAFVRALRLIKEHEAASYVKLQKLQKILHEELSTLDRVVINSTMDGSAYIFNMAVPGYKPEVIIHHLSEAGIIISTQSACSSKEMDKSRVLEACGATDAVAYSGLRISLSYQTTEADIRQFIKVFKETISKLDELRDARF